MRLFALAMTCLPVLLAAQVGHSQAQDGITFLTGHTDSIYAAAYSPDGKFLVTGGFDKTVRVWNVATGQLVRTIKDPTDLVLCVAVSRDGRQLAASGMDRVVRVYDMPMSDSLNVWPEQPGEVTALGLSTDGKRLLLGTTSGTARIIDTDTQNVLHELVGGSSPILDVAFSADRQVALAITADGKIYGWNAELGDLVGQIQVPELTSLGTFADNRTLICGAANGVGRTFLWPPVATKEIPGASGPVSHVACAPNSAWVGTSSTDGQVRLHQLADGAMIRALGTAGQEALSFAFSPDSTVVAIATSEGVISLWNANDGTALGQFLGHEGPIRDLAFNPNSQFLASVGQDGALRLWKTPLGASRELAVHTSPVTAMAASFDGNFLLTAAADKTVKLLQSANGQEVRQFAGHEAPVRAAAFTLDGARVATGGEDLKVRVFNTGDGALANTLEGLSSPAAAVAFAANGTQVAASGTDNTLKVWALDTNTVFKELPAQSGPVTDLHYLPDGVRLLASVGASVQVYAAADLAAGAKLDLGSPAKKMHVTADGKRAAVGCADGGTRVIDVDAMTILTTLKGGESPLTGVYLSADGLTLVASTEDRAVRVWNVAAQTLVERFASAASVADVFLAADRGYVSFAGSDGRLVARPISALASVVAHAGGAAAITFSVDGGRLATCGADNTAKVWQLGNLAALAPERAFAGATAALADVAISANQQQVAAVGADGQLRLWNLADGAPVTTIAVGSPLRSVALAPETQAAVAGDDGIVRLFDTATGLLLEQFAQHQGAVTSLEFSRDNKLLMTGGADTLARLWSPAGGIARQLVAGPIVELEVHPNGSQFFVASQENKVSLYNSNFTPAQVYETAVPVKALSRTANSQYLASAADKTLQLWNLGNAQLTASVALPELITATAAYSDGNITKVIAACADGVIRSFELKQIPNQNKFELVQMQECRGHVGPVNALALSADGRSLFSGAADRGARKWLAISGNARLQLGGHAEQVYALSFNMDGTHLASASSDKTIKLWNVADGANYANCTGHNAAIYGVTFHPTEDRLVSCSADKSVRFWAGASGSQERAVEQEIADALYSVEYVPAGNQVISGGLAKTWQVWNVGEDRPARTVPGHTDFVYKAGFSPNGQRVITLGYGGNLIFWNAADGTQLATVKVPADNAFSFAVSPDGKTVAVVTKDPRVMLVTVPAAAQ